MRAMLRAMPLAALLAGCRVTGTFECASDAQCTAGNATGVCEPNHACAFPDDACASGERYDDLASDDAVAGQCVGGEPGRPPGCEAWHPHHFDPCALPAPIGAFTLGAGVWTYDTDSDVLRGGPDIPHASAVIAQQGGTMARVLSVDSFTLQIGARLQISGSKPLIVAAWGEILLGGLIDASSSKLGWLGPGANDAACSASAPGESATTVPGSGGGGGGGFQGPGGHGGSGGDDTMLAMGGAGGGASPVPKLVRGGCAGERSGAAGTATLATPIDPATYVSGGAGGGAIQLTAKDHIGQYGFIIATGAGGSGGITGTGLGGGGGGAGGYIGLEAPLIDLGGAVVASGGAGGGGGSGMFTGAQGQGNPGADTQVSSGKVTGGSSPCGGAGGDAYNNMLLAGSAGGSNNNRCGGGGGGGGAGYIVIDSPMIVDAMAAPVIAPARTVNPP